MGEDQQPDAQQDEPQTKQDESHAGWGQLISEERQRELRGLLDRWENERNHEEGQGPFAGVELSGADVYWIYLHVRDKGLYSSELHLEGAILHRARLNKADLALAHLEGAKLHQAHLKRANLGGAHLEGASLIGAHLEHALLRGAHLEGARLSTALLEGAALGRVTLDIQTVLSQAILLDPIDKRPLRSRLLHRARYGPAMGDIHWRDFDLVELTQLEGLDAIDRLGDERYLGTDRPAAERYGNVERAYRQIAQRLRSQGVSDTADRLSDRAQVLRRKLLFWHMVENRQRPWNLPGDLVRWLFSWLLALLAGYGYHPGRSVFWYLAVIFGFAIAYYQLGPGEHVPFSQLGAVVFSVTSFHGRGFFPGGSPGHSLTLDDPVTVLAAIEAIIGLLIEISFIATFTQRFFGAR